MSRIAVWSLVAALSLAACTASSSTAPSPEPSSPAGVSALAEEAERSPEAAVAAVDDGGPTRLVRLVTLGDAYTQGTDTTTPRVDSWPAQVVESLERAGIRVRLINLAEHGVSSDALIEVQLPQVESWRPDVVTLQVGVNDILTGATAGYRANVTVILETLLDIVPHERILVVTTPDHLLTEWGASYGAFDADEATVAELNATLRELAQERDIEVIDIGQVNELVTVDPELIVQADPPVPYPTAKQYAGWAELIAPYVRDAIDTIEP